MEPIEINAGAWYLRALRADERMDDRPSLADLGEHDPGYVARRDASWADASVLSWAVCEPTTGELLAEVTLRTADGTIEVRARPGHTEAGNTGADAVRRFGVTLGVPPLQR